MSSSTRLAISLLALVAVAAGFWLLVLGPKRQKADELGKEAEQIRAALGQSESNLLAAVQARKSFPTNYQELVVLGKAVPRGDETPSLLVQLNRIADRAHMTFNSLKLGTGSGEEEASTETATAPPTEVPPTEAAASLLPLGATVGSAGLGVMPYNLAFEGTFFQIADFIEGVDALVDDKRAHVAVDGRLVTIGGFTLAPQAESSSNVLLASFSVATYVTPPKQGITAGASPGGPEEATTVGEPASAETAPR
jgi:Tfp pilus assembly protein PilO